MKNNEIKQSITLRQFILFIYKTQVGIGILTLPRDLSKDAGTDGWIALILGWIISIIMSIVIVKSMEQFPNDTLFDILPKIFGKWVGSCFSILWICYGFIAFTAVFYSSIFLINVWILPNTQPWMIAALFTLPLYMLSRNGVQVLGRYAEFVFLFSIWMYPLIFFALKHSHFLNLLPIIKEGWMPIVYTVKTTVLSFLGFEMAFLLYPYLEDKKKAVKGIIIANSASLVLYTSVTIMVFVYFSPYDYQSFIWPTLNIFKIIEFPFLERFEIVFIIAYLFVISMTGIPYFYLSIFSISKLTKIKSKKIILPFCLMFIICFMIISPSYSSIQFLSNLWGNTGLFFAFIFPIFLYIALKIKKGFFQNGGN